ncbi:TetR/AcrR family transcriptional regulator [Cytobacillus kochii]
MRENTKKKKREKILQSAEILFVENGIEKTTMNDIAVKAEMGVATIFRHFPKKDMIVDEVAAEKLKILLSFMEELSKKEDISYLEKITYLLDFFIFHSNKESGALPKILDYIVNYIAVNNFSFEENRCYLNVRDQLFSLFFDMIDAGANDGTIRSDINAREVIPTIINNFTVFTFKLAVQSKTNIIEPELPAHHQLVTMKNVILNYLTANAAK